MSTAYKVNILLLDGIFNIQLDEDGSAESHHGMKSSYNGAISEPILVPDDGNKPSNVSLLDDHCSGILRRTK